LLVERRDDKLVLEFTKQDSGSNASGFPSNSNTAIFAQAVLDCSIPQVQPASSNGDGSSKQSAASATIPPQQRKIQHWLEGTVDSSRYFTLRILAPNGRDEVLIGFGFRDRDPATDLRESLQHYESAMRRQAEAALASTASHDKASESLSASAFSPIPKLAKGEKIHINLGRESQGKPKRTSDSTMDTGHNRPTLLLRKPPPSAQSNSTPNIETLAAGATSAATTTTTTTTAAMDTVVDTSKLPKTIAPDNAIPENDTKTIATVDDDDDDWEAEFVSAVRLDDTQPTS
jgi:Protein of unknown function (DUF1681)